MSSKLRQTQYWTPIRGQHSAPIDSRVRISLPAPLGLHVSERLPALLKRHPRLTVETVFREEPSDLVGEGIDIEVRLGDVSDSSLICRRLGWATAFLVASPAYIAERGMPGGADEIAQHDCICHSRGGETRAWMFVNGADQLRAAIAPRMVFNNATAVYRATIAGGGLAILSHILAAEDILLGRLINVLPCSPPARLPITAVYASRRNLPMRVRTVLDFIADAVKEDELMTGAAC